MIRVHKVGTGSRWKCLPTPLSVQMTSKSCVKEVAVLRGHLSNIRCLTVLPLPKDGTMKGSDGEEEMEEALLVSGGGRAEFRLWLLAIHNGGQFND